MITLNLHINYDCPLSCRYCCQRQNPNLLEAYFTAEEMIEVVQKFMTVKNVENLLKSTDGDISRGLL